MTNHSCYIYFNHYNRWDISRYPIQGGEYYSSESEAIDECDKRNKELYKDKTLYTILIEDISFTKKGTQKVLKRYLTTFNIDTGIYRSVRASKNIKPSTSGYNISSYRYLEDAKEDLQLVEPYYKVYDDNTRTRLSIISYSFSK